MEKEFLPVGSVVLLKGGTKRVMVTGFCSVDNDDTTKIYDYTGCLYPEGIINSNEICLFNDSQIEQVFFKGFEDQEEIDFKKNLNKTVNEYLQKNGAEALPITLVDGEIAVSKVYPTTKQMSEWTGVNLDLMPAK